jgi:hypothetical protein
MVDARNTRLHDAGQGQDAGCSAPREHRPASLALAKAVTAVLQPGGLSIKESFAYATASVHAEQGLLLEVRTEEPLDLEILCSDGQAEAGEAHSSAAPLGGWAAPIREAVETRQGIIRPHFACVPVLDELTHVPMAVLYLQPKPGSAFDEEDLAGLSAYAAALSHTLALRAGGFAAELSEETARADARAGPEIVGTSDATRALLRQLQAYLPSVGRPDPPPILVLGESGTGKELVARYLHHYSPKRSRGPFQAVNCAALRGELAESRLFGHVRGAFTGAVAEAKGLFRIADNGVFFLDEIGELSAEGQALLLRVLENRTVQSLGGTREVPVDVQIIVAFGVRQAHSKHDGRPDLRQEAPVTGKERAQAEQQLAGDGPGVEQHNEPAGLHREQREDLQRVVQVAVTLALSACHGAPRREPRVSAGGRRRGRRWRGPRRPTPGRRPRTGSSGCGVRTRANPS